MSGDTVKRIAALARLGVDEAIAQLAGIGITGKTADDTLSRDEKLKFMAHLRDVELPSGDGGGSLVTSRTIKETARGGAVNTIEVVVRKKRALKKRPRRPAAATAASGPAPAAPGTGATVPESATTASAAETTASVDATTAAGPASTASAAPTTAAADGKAKPAPSDKDRKLARKAKERRRSELRLSQDKRRQRRRKKQARKPRKVQATLASQHGAFAAPTEPVVRRVVVPETISVGDLAEAMSVKAADLIRKLMEMGSMATINQMLDQETAAIMVEEMGHTADLAGASDPEALLQGLTGADAERELRPRPPVVTVMGHVDHGKTSLLDRLRKTRVAAAEAGGITQHIGAYRVATARGDITFLDTPGHEAFSAMRARGAGATDLVILVVAADDGVKPQTVEAIRHARNAEVPIVVAVNKMDKEGADPGAVRQELAGFDVVTEEFGGDVLLVPVSAKTGAGMDALLEAVMLQAELLDLRAAADGPAAGVVVEARLDRGRGPVATLLVREGLLRAGDVLLAGRESGRARAMRDEFGGAVTEAGPSVPVEVQGLSGVPAAGEPFVRVGDERRAREVAVFRQGRHKDARHARQQAAILSSHARMGSDAIGADEGGTLNLLIKADVQGSVEALSDACGKLAGDSTDVAVNIIHSAVGGINESDINLAAAAGAVVVAFNVRADAAAARALENNAVDVRHHSVIYQALDEVRDLLSGMLKPVVEETILASADVREVFRISGLAVAGCYVSDGTVRRDAEVRVLRDNTVVYSGRVASLRRFKEDVAEVKNGMECGITIKNYNDLRAADRLEIYHSVEVPKTL